MRRPSALAALGGGALFLGLLAATSPAQASGGGSADNCSTAQPPVANTWRDAAGNYRGTRISYREHYYNKATTVYETFGQDYYRVETWYEGDVQGDQRVDCKQDPKPAEPEPPAPQPVTGGGVGGGGVHLPVRGYTVMISNPVIRTGTVRVGAPQPIVEYVAE